MGAAPSVEAAPEAIAQVEPPQRSGWSRLWLILAVIATVLGVALMATGQYLLDDYWQDQIEKNPALWYLKSPVLIRTMPGIVGLVVGGLIAAIGLWQFAAPLDPSRDREPAEPRSAVQRRVGWALIGVGAALTALLCA